jgi:hypothetical protein
VAPLSYNGYPTEMMRLIGALVGAATREGFHGRAKVTKVGSIYTVAISVDANQWLSERELKRRAREIACEKCQTTLKLTKPTDVDGSFAELLAAGWMHFAKKGAGRERWTWQCPSCKPRVKPETMGLSTPGPVMSPKRED